MIALGSLRMKPKKIFTLSLLACLSSLIVDVPVFAATGVQVGPSGKTYASSGIQCALNPITGMAPFVQAGLYNPKRTTKATVSLNDTAMATVTFFSPDANVWLANQINTVAVALDKRTADSYTFDATPAFNQLNLCIPDTSGNTTTNVLETAESLKSSATVTPGCALNPLTGRAQPYVNLFDDGPYLLNVSVNNVPLTQLSATRPHTPVFLSAGWNVISAANGSLSTDYFVRDGGDGTCLI